MWDIIKKVLSEQSWVFRSLRISRKLRILGKRAFTAIKFSQYWTYCLIIYCTTRRNLREYWVKFNDPLKNSFCIRDESEVSIGFRLTLVWLNRWYRKEQNSTERQFSKLHKLNSYLNTFRNFMNWRCGWNTIANNRDRKTKSNVT